MKWDTLLSNIDNFNFHKKKLFKHIINSTGHDIVYRKNDDSLNSVLDDLIMMIRPYGYNTGEMAMFFVGYGVLETLMMINYGQIRIKINENGVKAPKYNTYRSIDIVPTEGLDDEILLVSKEAFLEYNYNINININININYNNKLSDKKIIYDYRLPTIVNPKLIAVSRNQLSIFKEELSNMTDRELRIQVLDRDKNKYPYELIRAEVRKRGLI